MNDSPRLRRLAKRIVGHLPEMPAALAPAERTALRKLMSDQSIHPVLMDVGAAGSSPKQWRPLAPASTIVGFEPDQRNPDTTFGRNFARAVMVDKIVVPDDDLDESNFILTKSPSCSSLLEPDLEQLGSFCFRDLFTPVGSVTLKTTSLNRIVEEQELAGIHWLKLDTQGVDLRLLKSLNEANRKHLLAVDIEPGFVDAYRGEDLFPVCHSWLKAEGFWLADLNYQAYAKIRPETLANLEGLVGGQETLLAGLRKSPTAAEALYLREVAWMEKEVEQPELWLIAFAFAAAMEFYGYAADLALSYKMAFGATSAFDQMWAFLRTSLSGERG